MQLKKLWDFMQVDMEADRFETKMRQNEKRQTLLRQRNLLMDLQNSMKKLEEDVSVMQDRQEALRDEIERLQKTLSELLEKVKNNPPKSEEEAAEQMALVEKQLETLKRYESELAKMRKDADAKDRQQHDIRVQAARTKGEYDKLKVEYDVEFKADSAELKKLRARAEAESQKQDPAQLAEYKNAKAHCTPPMAKLINGQCGGCFMSLPGATLLAMKEKDGVSHCDNCGRILFIEE